MEQINSWDLLPSRKRKMQEKDESVMNFDMEELNQDMLEKILSWLPASTFFRLKSVCKRWKSVADSSSFKLACSEIPSRDPWFFMVNPNLTEWTIFDSAENSWKKLNHPTASNSMPVASSGCLVCFRNEKGELTATNPVTGFSRKLPRVDLPESQPLVAIAMNTCPKTNLSYKIVLISGDLSKLSCKVYNSNTNSWDNEILLKRNESHEFDSNNDNAVYFLSKVGTVVATDMQRSPSKQYSSVMTVKNGEEIAYFLSSSGTIVACNVTRGSFFEYPRLLPAFYEYSIDMVECRGEILVVLLCEFLGSASLRVWRFDENRRSWQQIAAMPPAMSHEFYGKKVDINCVGAGDRILVCLNAAEFFGYVMCDVRSNEWVELPGCYRNGEAVEFMSAFSFEPRIEASV